MRTLLPLLVLLLTASSAWAGSPEADAAYSSSLAIAMLIPCGLFALVLLILSLYAFLLWYSWKRRRGTKVPPGGGSKHTPDLPPFPRPGA